MPRPALAVSTSRWRFRRNFRITSAGSSGSSQRIGEGRPSQVRNLADRQCRRCLNCAASRTFNASRFQSVLPPMDFAPERHLARKQVSSLSTDQMRVGKCHREYASSSVRSMFPDRKIRRLLACERLEACAKGNRKEVTMRRFLTRLVQVFALAIIGTGFLVDTSFAEINADARPMCETTKGKWDYNPD